MSCLFVEAWGEAGCPRESKADGAAVVLLAAGLLLLTCHGGFWIAERYVWGFNWALVGPCVKVLLDPYDESPQEAGKKIVKTDAPHSHGGPHTHCAIMSIRRLPRPYTL